MGSGCKGGSGSWNWRATGLRCSSHSQEEPLEIWAACAAAELGHKHGVEQLLQGNNKACRTPSEGEGEEGCVHQSIPAPSFSLPVGDAGAVPGYNEG